MSLDSILEAQEVLSNELGISEKEKNLLRQTTPLVVVVNKPGIYAAYDFLSNMYIFSKDALKDTLAIGEEVAHSIRLRLNKAARNYLLNPINDIKNYIKRMNIEEHFGRLGALIYVNYKGINQHNKLWSKIKNNMIILAKNPFEYLTHIFGYQKAEHDFNSGRKSFNKSLLYNNDLSLVYG